MSNSTVIWTRSITEPIREGLPATELWEREDRGLICSWENGRRKAMSDPELASAASNGQLPELNWKLGSVYYLAYWQGLRGEDLKIDKTILIDITCTLTNRSYCFGVGPERVSRQGRFDREFLKRQEKASKSTS